jgi:tryptophanyl-tRNA synthetase
MHTSYGNVIYLKDSPAETTRKVMSMFTDPTRIHATDPGHVEGNPVFTYLDVFHPDAAEVADLKERYRAGKVGDIQVKQRCAEVLNDYLAPLRVRRAEIAARPRQVLEILQHGTDRARPVAAETVEEVMRLMGLSAGLDLNAETAAVPEVKGAFC